MSARSLALFCLAASVGGCAAGGVRGDRRGDGKTLLATVALDEQQANAAMIDRWRMLAMSRGADEPLTTFALERLETLVAEGVDDAAAGRALAQLATFPLSSDGKRRVAMMRARLARLQGDDAAAAGLEHEAGCGLPWRAGGYVGRLPRLDLTRPPGDATADGKLTPALLRGCRVVALSPDGKPAALPIVLDFALDRRGPVELAIASDAAYQLWADGRPGAAPDGREPLRRVRRYHVELPAGRHRIVITGAGSYGRFDPEVSVLGRGLGLRTEGLPAADGAVVAASIVEDARPSCAVGRDKLDVMFLEAAAAARDGDNSRARVAIDKLIKTSPKLAVALALAARIAVEDPTVPTRLARDRGRRLYERALESDPKMARVRYEAGRQALMRDRAREAMELAQSAPERRELWAALLLGEVLRARSRDAEVGPVLDAVPRAQGQACAVVEARAADDRMRHRPVSLDVVRRLSRCRVGSSSLGDALRQRGALDEATQEYERVISIDPLSEGARVSLGETQLQRGKAADAAKTFAGLIAVAPRAASYRLHLIDALYAADRRADAQRALDDAIALDPENAELAAAGRSLGRGVDPATEVDLDRINGRDVIAEFERSGHHYDGPAVFLLDRTVSRVYRTGGQRTITHNIIKVLAKEGIDRWGEWHLPRNAEVLTLCAWKPDGSRLEPEELPEKESISIPGLAAGDYVEVEYLERAAPPGAFIDGFLAERFFFASFDAPLDRSEYTIVSPADMPVELDARGVAPKLEQSTRKEGRNEVAVRTFVAHGVPQRFAEPGAAPEAEFLPSVRASARVSREAWRAYLVDLGWASRRRDPALETLARALTAGDKDDRTRLGHLDAWVRKNVQQGGALDEGATSILARREGNRVTLLAALAEAAGMKSRVLLGRSARSPAIETQLESFNEALVEVAGVLDDPRYRHGLPGELSAALRGGLALVLEPGDAAPITLPRASNDRREMKVQIALRADGGGQVSVEETLRGWPALEWRESLEKLPADRVRPQFEQRTLGYFFPGAALDKLNWENADRDDVPFVVRYTLDAPSIARRQGGALVLPAPFAAQLLRRYTTGRPRTSPIFVDEVSSTDLELAVTLPAGVRVQVAPEVHREEPIGRFEQKTWIDAGVLKLRSRFFLPTGRIAVEAWPRFLAWVATVDQAEAAIAVVDVAGDNAGSTPSGKTGPP